MPRDVSTGTARHDEHISVKARPHGVQEALSLRQYEMASTAEALLTQGEKAFVHEVFQMIGAHNPRRLALLVADVFGGAYAETGYKKNYQALQALKEIVTGADYREPLKEQLRNLPTRDAHLCRMNLFEVGCDESTALAAAAMIALAGEVRPSMADIYRCIGHGGRQTDFTGKHPPLAKRIDKTVAERFYSRSEQRELAPHHQQMVDGFYRITKDLFSPRTYGYSLVADALVLDKYVPEGGRSSIGVADIAHRRKEKKFLSRVFVPWPQSPDYVHERAHQCVDSASVARSYFVERGIPADVYHFSVKGFSHNVAVAFFPDGEKFHPYVIDASPFRGYYELCGAGSPTYWAPLGVEAVRGIREGAVGFAEGHFGSFSSRADQGLLPWFCDDSSVGRIIGWGGVFDQPVHFERCMERGTDEFYGCGERDRFALISLSVLDTPGKPLTMRFMRDSSGEVALYQQRDAIAPELLEYGAKLAREHLPLVEATIKRMDIPVGRVSR